MNTEKFLKYVDSAIYPTNRGKKSERRSNEIEKAVNNIPEEYKYKKILMLGCGDGCELEVLKERGFTDVIGITYDKNEFKDAKMEDNKIVRGEMHELPFEDNTFDFVYSKETLEHSIAPYIALCELNRVMKVGAKSIHYIAEGTIKQSDWFHFSCFPPFVWIDLFHLTRLEVYKVLTYSEDKRYKETERAYFSKKIEDKNYNKRVDVYNLYKIMDNIEWKELEL